MHKTAEQIVMTADPMCNFSLFVGLTADQAVDACRSSEVTFASLPLIYLLQLSPNTAHLRKKCINAY